jgi:L-2,4-diaminobutyrate decarboxylase
MPWSDVFLTNDPESHQALKKAITLAFDGIIEHYAKQPTVYSGIAPDVLSKLIDEVELMPEYGIELEQIQRSTNELILSHSMNLGDANCMAHLHCPPMIPAIASELIIAATNQSMDSWDQSPSASILEQQFCQWLCQNFDYPKGDASFTSGGTQSNQMALLLARDKLVKKRLQQDCQKTGLPAEATKYRIYCSQAAHFSLQQSLSILGLGTNALVTIETDHLQRMATTSLEKQLQYDLSIGLIPMAICATAGTTDFGSIDPVAEIANIAEKFQVWFHVDAAYGGALQFLPSHKPALAGIEKADSITIDFHKLFYQPISCGAFLLKDCMDFDLIRLNADYLNPHEDEALGLPNLVSKSIQTTRRFDALKLFFSLQSIGVSGLEKIIDTTLELAKSSAVLIQKLNNYELAVEPELNAIVFRWIGNEHEKNEVIIDKLNQKISQKLLMQGIANIAKTRFKQRAWLKLTLLNPQTTITDIESLLATIDDGIKNIIKIEKNNIQLIQDVA